MQVFLSYHFDSEDETFVHEVHYFLRKQPGLGSFYWSQHGMGDDFRVEIEKELQKSEAMIIFASKEAGKTQLQEVAFYGALPEGRRILVQLADAVPPGLALETARMAPIRVPPPSSSTPETRASETRKSAVECAKSIIQRLGLPWLPDDGIPLGYPFAYEKDIIEEYVKGNGHASRERVAEGCPSIWPIVEHLPTYYDNPLDPDEIGKFTDDTRIIVDSRLRTSEGVPSLALLEARPRERLRYPDWDRQPRNLGVGILVSGGIAPGINAVIDGIVKRHTLYAEALRNEFPYALNIKGFAEGFRGFFHAGVQSKHLTVSMVEPFAEHGGSLLGTSRPEELLGSDPKERAECRRRIVMRLCDHPDERVHILYVIGGDGSMRAAHALQRTADDMGKDLAVVGIPKTMDNDILWIWQSFGFLSAVEKAREVILNMHTEVASNPRLGIIQLFGSDSGFVASHAAYSTACDLVLIPEDPLTMDQIFRHVSRRLQDRLNGQTSPYGLVVMAETALPEDAGNYINDPDVHLSDREKAAVAIFLKQGRRVTGQTPDELRTAGLKMVSRLLQKRIRELTPLKPKGAVFPNQGSYWRDYRVVTNEPRHLIRSIRPSVSDVIFGERLGTLAVDNAMAGYRDFVVSQWLTEFVLVPLDLIVLGRKRVPIEGIFWKSVRAKTGQPRGTRTAAVVPTVVAAA
jgi:6-phosphofructokinase 1